MELALLPGSWAFLVVLGILAFGFLWVWGKRGKRDLKPCVPAWKSGVLLVLFLLGVASFLHFALFDFFLLQLVVAASVLLVFKLHGKTMRYWNALVYVTVFLLALATWDLEARNIGVFWLNLGLFAVGLVPLASFELMSSGEPTKLAFLFSLFIASSCAQIFFSLAFWPVSPLVKAMLLLLSFYLQISLLLSVRSGEIVAKKLLLPLLVTVAGSLLIFFTAEWLPFI